MSDKPDAAGGRWTRRDVLGVAASAVAPYVVPVGVLGLGRASPPSDQVRVGVIGCGGRARLIREAADVRSFRVCAACDCFRERAEAFAAENSNGQRWGVYDDFRVMIEREKLDAVMVETTTHARAWVSILSMQMGMDVYIEKPMSLTIAEGRAMVDAARRYQRVTQVGTQQRSMPMNNWASDLVKSGRIGRITTVLAPNFVGPVRWEKSDDESLGDVDPRWDVWTNQAPLRAWSSALQSGWAKWWDYDGGGLCFGVTGWGAHSYDQVNRALGTDDTGPELLVLEEAVAERATGRFEPRAGVGDGAGLVGELDTGAAYHELAQLSGPRAKVRMQFAGGAELRLHLDGDRGPGLGAIFTGEQGKIEINRNKIASNPPDIAEAADNPGPNRRSDTAYHIENWVECIKNRQRCTADIEVGQRSNTLCHLVNIVRAVGLVGKDLAWDPVNERFSNCEKGNSLLDRPRRRGYLLPSG